MLDIDCLQWAKAIRPTDNHPFTFACKIGHKAATRLILQKDK